MNVLKDGEKLSNWKWIFYFLDTNLTQKEAEPNKQILFTQLSCFVGLQNAVSKPGKKNLFYFMQVYRQKILWQLPFNVRQNLQFNGLPLEGVFMSLYTSKYEG